MATIEEVAEALRARDITVEIIDVGEPGSPTPGINVRMANPHQRHADDTIWPPVGRDGWVWGVRFQHKLPDDATAEDVAEAVENTVRAKATDTLQDGTACRMVGHHFPVLVDEHNAGTTACTRCGLVKESDGKGTVQFMYNAPRERPHTFMTVDELARELDTTGVHGVDTINAIIAYMGHRVLTPTSELSPEDEALIRAAWLDDGEATDG